jgi:chloramphenicol O-acetyltransferase type B
MFKFLKNIKSKIKSSYWTLRIKKSGAKITGQVKVNGPSYVTKRTTIGNNVHFNGMKIQGKGKISIGDNFHSGWGCIIMTHFHNYNNGLAIPYDNTYIIQDVLIEDNVWFGINVTVLPGVKIGEGAIIQAGSVLVSDIPPLAIAGGHPAKVFKYRNSDHYYQLKNEKKFN